jgi:hypothetical protein
MFDLFKKVSERQPQDVKELRNRLVQFIKQQLSKAEGGEGANIKGLCLFVAAREEDRPLYELAVYADEGDRFQREEIQRIADDYALDLPQGWTMETSFVEALPAEAVKVPGLDAALFIQTRKRSLPRSATAYLRVLHGTAEQDQYTLNSSSGKVTIGREKKVQVTDGFYRINTIAFPGNVGDESNKYISRQHAHIIFDADSGNFYLFADEGGIPPRNKIKIKSAGDAEVKKLHSTEIGYILQEGDQIVLGESAVLLFSYQKEEEA